MVLLDALALFEKAGDEPGQAQALCQLARLSVASGAAVPALRACRLGLRAADGEPGISGEIYGVAAEALARRNHMRLAGALYRHAEVLFLGARRPQRAFAAALCQAILLGPVDPLAARARLHALLGRATDAGDAHGFAQALIALGELDLQEGVPENARLCAHTAAAALERGRLPRSEAATLLLGRALAALGEIGEARQALGDAVALISDGNGRGDAGAGHSIARARALEELGWVLLELDRRGEARSTLQAARHAWQQGGEPVQVARTELAIAATYGRDNRSEALRHIVCAIDLLGRSPRPPRELLGTARDLLGALPPGRLTYQLLDLLDDLGARRR